MSADVRLEIDSFLEQWPDAEWGPAHIVLSDWNLEDVHIRWCLGLCRAAITNDSGDLVDPIEDTKLMYSVDWYRSHNDAELMATVAFLEHLLSIPESQRDLDDE